MGLKLYECVNCYYHRGIEEKEFKVRIIDCNHPTQHPSHYVRPSVELNDEYFWEIGDCPRMINKAKLTRKTIIEDYR